MTPYRCSLIVLSGVFCLACGDSLSNTDRRTLRAWLTCDDCSSGQRGAVEVLGDKAVAQLGVALKGPSADQLTIMRGKFGSSYRLAEMGSRVPGLDSAHYNNFREENYTANYQKRAALSLGDIGTDAAKAELDAAINDSVARRYRPDVIRVIKFARSRAGAVTHTGKIIPYRVQFADTVRVRPDSLQHFGAHPTLVIEDSLFPDSDIPVEPFADSIRFPAVAAFGVHMVTIHPDANAQPVKIAMFVASMADPNDRGMSTCGPTDIACMINHAPDVDVGHNGPGKPSFFTVSPGTPADAMDFFRINNASHTTSLPVTAVVEWRGDGLIDLEWKRCGTTISISQAAHGGGSRSVQLGGTIPPGECWVLQVTLVNAKQDNFGKLTVSSP